MILNKFWKSVYYSQLLEKVFIKLIYKAQINILCLENWRQVSLLNINAKIFKLIFY